MKAIAFLMFATFASIGCSNAGELRGSVAENSVVAPGDRLVCGIAVGDYEGTYEPFADPDGDRLEIGLHVSVRETSISLGGETMGILAEAEKVECGAHGFRAHFTDNWNDSGVVSVAVENGGVVVEFSEIAGDDSNPDRSALGSFPRSPAHLRASSGK